MIVNVICEHLSQRIEADDLSNNDMIQIIEHLGAYLNLMTISDYAKDKKISYNGAKNFRNVVTIFNTKFVIDNE